MSYVEARRSIFGRPYIRYSFAVLTVAVAFLLRLAIERTIGAELPPFLTFYPAIMLAALLCGLWPGLLATVLASLVVDYWLLPPRGKFAIAGAADAVALAFFFLVGVFMSVVAEANRRYQRRIASYKRELALRATEDRLQQMSEYRRLALEAAELGAWDYHFETGEVFWDPSCRNLFGVAEGGRFDYDKWIARIHPEDRPGVDTAVKQAMAGAGNGVYRREFRVIWPDESIHWVSSHGRVHFEGQGDKRRAVRFIGVNRDTTRRKQSERVRARLAAIVESSADAIISKNLDGLITSWNQSAERLFGYSAEEAIGQPITCIIPPDRLAEETAILERLRRGDSIDHYESVRMDKSGRLIDVSLTISPIRDASGTVVGVSTTARDISDRIQAERVLETTLQRFYVILSNMHSGVLLVTNDGRIEFANQAFCDRFGLEDSPGELVGLSPGEVLGKIKNAYQRPDEALARIREIVDRGEPVTGEELAMQGGKTFLRDFTPLTVDGKPFGRLWHHTDITERKRAAEALRQQADMLRLSFDAIIVWRLGAGIESWNRGAEQLYGFSESEALGRATHELLRSQHPVPWLEIEAKLHQLGNWEGELRHLTKDGREVIVSARHQLMLGADGVERVLETNRDITERKQSEQRIAHLASFPELNADPIFETDLEGKVTYGNPAALKQFPMLKRAGAGLPIMQDWSRVVASLKAGAQRSTVREVESDGRVFLQRIHYFPGLEVVRAYFTDITARKQAEQALQASEHRWATTLQSIGDAVISTDAAGNIEFMNDVAQSLTGWGLPDAKGRDLSDIFHIIQEVTRIIPESPVAKVIRLGKVVGLANHTVLINRAGVEIPIEDSAAPIRDSQGNVEGIVLVFHDVMEQRKVELALRNSDRLATTGRLAATIAHEIHNPLDTVGNLLYLIGQGIQDSGTREYVTMASAELARVTQITQQMLAFQREAAKPVPVYIGEILENVVALYERKLQMAGIRLQQQFDFDGHILALPGEMRQVFANLVGNAIEAVGARRGTIRLRAYRSSDWRSGRLGLRVVVADDGPGIPADVRPRIFDPFFTTKGESGTGLGLWIASDILRKYEGTIRLRSSTEPQHSGTCFSVFLPLNISSR